MITNQVYTTTRGTDPEKFVRINGFAAYSPSGLSKLIVRDFRNAGKIRDYVRKHKIAVDSYGCNFNGYGYSDHVFRYLLSPRDASKVQHMIEAKEEEKRNHPKKKKSADEIMAEWARRLARFTGIPFEDAINLADEKLAAHYAQIQELEERQCRRDSSKRQKLIDKLYRENPLRRIVDEEHAYRILAASVRHTASDYEDRLREAQEMARMGELDYENVRDYARQHTEYYGTIDSQFFNKEELENE